MCLRLQHVPDTDVPDTAVSLRATVLQMSLRGTRTADVPESDRRLKVIRRNHLGQKCKQTGPGVNQCHKLLTSAYFRWSVLIFLLTLLTADVSKERWGRDSGWWSTFLYEVLGDLLNLA